MAAACAQRSRTLRLKRSTSGKLVSLEKYRLGECAGLARRAPRPGVAAGPQRPRGWLRAPARDRHRPPPAVSLVVNVASECGFTDQHYRALQQLQRDLGPHHFNVLAFPCNQFGQQEPDSNKEIESFARRTYSVSFPMFSKIAVTGTGAHPAFKYLAQTSGKEPTWNFWKYLVAPDGKVVGAWDPTVSVEEVRPQITALVRKLILRKREDL
nr:glutathione peroxidase 7 [Macaca nemestrina]